MPQKRVRAVIVENSKVLLIKRFKNTETYFVFPGGGVDDSEDEKMALIRECLEEVNAKVEVGEVIFRQSVSQGEESFYLCKIVSGVVGVGSGQEYKNMQAENIYEPTWISLDIINDKNIKPREIVRIIL